VVLEEALTAAMEADQVDQIEQAEPVDESPADGTGKRPYNRLTQEQEDDIVARAANGEKGTAIAAAMGIKLPTVYNALKRRSAAAAD
jgi:DNA-directed RNA polymerase specialized sigma24 family protein